MTPDRLLDHFDRISDAPGAIQRLSRFILDLAVRGKLVEQDPNDEPASELLKQIIARLRSDGLGIEATPADELPFDLPVSWSWIKVGYAAHVEMGQSPPSEHYNQSGQGMPFYQGKTDFGKRHPTPRYWCSQPSKLARKNDILISVRAPVGPTNVANEDCCIGRGLAALRPHEAVDLEFFLFCLKSFESVLASLGFGTTFVAINKKQLMSFPIPLPPVAEQHRIVAKVDELMALCGRLEAAQAERESRRDRLAAVSLHRLNNGADADEFREHVGFHLRHLPRLTTRPEHIQQLRQTILNLAVRGKLVPQDPNDEPVSELLKRIQAEKERLLKAGTITRVQPMLSIDVAEIPAALPDGWEWVKLGPLLLGDSQNGYSKKPDDTPDGIPILRISAGTVRKDGLVAEEEHKLIGGISAAQREQFGLQPGDLLACRFNGNRSFVGRLSLYSGYLVIKPIYPDKLIRLRLLSQFVLPKLVRCFAESSVVRRDIESYCATTVGNWGISASNLKEVKIPLPPLPEQHRIVAKVDELMALCDRLETQLTTTQTESRRLLEAVLHETLSRNLQVTQ